MVNTKTIIGTLSMANYEPIHYFPVRYVLFSALGAIHAENPYLVYLLCQKMG